MPGTNEWYAVEVGGTVTELMSNLNTLQASGYEIFSVVISPRGWTIVARKPQAEQKPVPALEATPAEPPKIARGTVALHKPHKR